MNTTLTVTQRAPMPKSALLARRIEASAAEQARLSAAGEMFRAGCVARVIGRYRRELELALAKGR